MINQEIVFPSWWLCEAVVRFEIVIQWRHNAQSRDCAWYRKFREELACLCTTSRKNITHEKKIKIRVAAKVWIKIYIRSVCMSEWIAFLSPEASAVFVFSCSVLGRADLFCRVRSGGEKILLKILPHQSPNSNTTEHWTLRKVILSENKGKEEEGPKRRAALEIRSYRSSGL